MAKTTKSASKRSERDDKHKKSIVNSNGTRSTMERVLWLTGFAILLFSVYLFIASIAHFFDWKEDLSIVMSKTPVATDAEVENVCGKLGAYLAHGLTGMSFGFCGLLLPVIGMLFGSFLLLERSRVLWRTALSIMLVTICGSLTFAAITGADGFVGSGWGGEFGIAIVGMLKSKIGGMGVLLTIVSSWILTGVVINLNFIDFLKRTTISGVEQGKGAFAALKNYILSKRTSQSEDDAEDEVIEEDDAVEAEDNVVVLGATGAEKTDEPIDPITAAIVGGVAVAAVTSAEAAETVVGGVGEVVADGPASDAEKTEEPTEENAVAENEIGASKSNIDVVEVYKHTEGELSSAEVEKRRMFNPDSTPDYQFPTMDCLLTHENGAKVSLEEIEQNKQRIEEALGNFGVPIISMTATTGPTVTLYEIVQEAGVKISKVKNLESDIAQSLKALGIRIIAPIPGKGTIGIEVPNINKETVSMRSAIKSEKFQNFKAELPVVIGRTIQNENFVFDLAKMPHLLVAGATGQGKSVGLNAIITSLLYRKDPSQLKFVLIDPKTVEFSLYEKLEKHFLAKMESEDETIVKDPKKAIYTLNSLCVEMENRLKKCGEVGVRNIVEYNDMVRKHEIESDLMPYIVVVIDEFADLIMCAKEVEKPVMRLAQKARAIGIHLIVATQRPDVKVITGTIKANFPARIAFRVMQMTDSRTIIDQPGAQQLIGRGDMLMSVNGELTRVQCAFVDTPEVRDVVNHISKQPFPYPSGTYLLPDFEDGSASGGSGSSGANFGSESGAPCHYDEHFAAVARDAVAAGRLSTSSIQSIYNVGFNRAGRITRQLEQAGIVGPANGAKPRDVRIHDMAELEALLAELGLE